MTEKHLILGDKVTVHKRERSSIWQCSSFIQGKNCRISTKERSLAKAKEFAEDWFLELKGKRTPPEAPKEMVFKAAAERFIEEYRVITRGERNEIYVRGHTARLRNHLIPFMGSLGLSKITSGLVQDYRVYRLSKDPFYKPPSRSTMHHEIVTLRQVLKLAVRYGWLSALPDLSEPYRSSTKIVHRAWFSEAEYATLFAASEANTKIAYGRPWQHSAEQVHDLIVFMANTGLRPDEVNRLCRVDHHGRLLAVFRCQPDHHPRKDPFFAPAPPAPPTAVERFMRTIGSRRVAPTQAITIQF